MLLSFLKFVRGFVVKKTKSKEYKRLDLDEIAKALGAKRITDPKEIEEFKKKYGLSHSLLPMSKKLDSTLKIRCRNHPRYKAKRKPKTRCRTCHLLYVLRWQNSKEGQGRLGGLNPYQFIVSGYEQLEDACSEFEVF